jgi:hypothetical protein
MSFRPGKGRVPFIAAGGGGGSVSAPMIWQEVYYPDQMQSTGTAVLTDLAFGALGILNVYNMINSDCQIFAQGIFHPYYDGGAVTCKVAFHCPNANPVGARQIGIALRAWSNGELLDQAIPPGTSVNKTNTLPGEIMLYFPATAIAVQGSPAADAFYELWIKRNDAIANSIYISSVQLTYTLTKKVI